MKFLYFSILSFVCFYTALTYDVKPAPMLTQRLSWMDVCRKSDPELEVCTTEFMNKFFLALADGIPEMKIESYEPLHLKKVSIMTGEGSAITLSGHLHDAEVYGTSKSTIDYSRFNFRRKTWKFGVTMPHLLVKSQYVFNGKVMFFPLTGKGLCELDLHNVVSKVTTSISFKKKGGREIIHIDEIKTMDFTVGNFKITLHNLFNGNRQLGDIVNQAINENGQAVIADLKETIAESLGDIFKNLMNDAFSKMPLDLWLMSDEQYGAYLESVMKEN